MDKKFLRNGVCGLSYILIISARLRNSW